MQGIELARRYSARHPVSFPAAMSRDHKYPRPDTSQPARLAELEAFSILDTAPEESFDDAVQVARLVCQAPVALMSLVADNRQWFKARIGFPFTRTDISSSICAYMLDEPDLLIIPDLAADPRTRDNPLVTGEPFIRFYAGAPLRTASGHTLGSLCVVDHQPRPELLNESQQDSLRRLARQVMTLLRDRRQVAEMQSTALLDRAAATRRSALIELSDCLRDATSILEITTRAAEIVGRTLNGSRAGYGELDAACEHVTVLQDSTAPGEISIVGRHRLADYGAVEYDVGRDTPVVVNDVETDVRTVAKASAFGALNVQARLSVPVQERGRTVGIIFVHSPAARAWAPEEIAFTRNVVNRLQVGIARLRGEEQQAILNRELSHRMKNTLAVVQAIATQTLRNAADLASARDALAVRLIALSTAHDLLLTGERESASLEAVIRGALSVHDARMNRLRVNGPNIHVGSSAALTLALIVHELATNAGKYGALSVGTGSVRVQWELDTGTLEPIVRLRWIERGGPPVRPPTRFGFGRRLIERGLGGASNDEVRLRYEPEGVVYELAAPLRIIEADE